MKVVVVVNITKNEAKELKEDGFLMYHGTIVYDPIKVFEFSEALAKYREQIKRRQKKAVKS